MEAEKLEPLKMQEAICLPTPKPSLWERVSTRIRNAWDNHGRKPINEGMRPQDEWYKEASDKGMTLKTLPKFLKKLSRNYSHDYGTICHALAASAIAAATAMNRTSQGGITGFQSGIVMWQFIREWGMDKKDKPLRLVDYGNLLYPQYEDYFDKAIGADTHKWLIEQAQKSIDANTSGCKTGMPSCSPKVLAHWQSIVDGKVPFGFTVVEK